MDELKIEKIQVYKAIKTLKQLNELFINDESRKKSLLEAENEQPIFIQVTLKKIPRLNTVKCINVRLGNTLLKDTTEVCLFAGDLDKKNRKAEIEPDVLHYKNMLKEHNISKITEVITLRQLRTEYKTYETKRQLVAAYDFFLADNRITGVLHRFLGKFFFNKRKLPLQINMKTSNLKEQVEKALSLAVIYVTGHGNSCISEIAHLEMDNKKIFQNIKAVLKALVENIPGKSQNILGIYIKSAKSKAVPLYMSFDNPNEVQFHETYKEEDVEAEDLSTLPYTKVKVFRSGRISVIRENRRNFRFRKSHISSKKSVLGKKRKLSGVDSIELKQKKKKIKLSKSNILSKNSSLVGKKENNSMIKSENLMQKVKKSKQTKSNVSSKKSLMVKKNKEDSIMKTKDLMSKKKNKLRSSNASEKSLMVKRNKNNSVIKSEDLKQKRKKIKLSNSNISSKKSSMVQKNKIAGVINVGDSKQKKKKRKLNNSNTSLEKSSSIKKNSDGSIIKTKNLKQKKKGNLIKTKNKKVKI